MSELRLLSSKTYTNFVTIDEFLLEIWSKQMFRPTERQTLHCQITFDNSITIKT